MSSSFELFSALSQFSGPALTWYASQENPDVPMSRQELGGPVLSRWLAKTANLLGTELADLFDDSPTPRSILIDLPHTWQEIIWAIAASIMGWDLYFPTQENPTPSAHTTDVLVTNTASPHSAAHIEHALTHGTDVLVHNTTALALSWNGALPPGAIDALEAIMSQPDALVVDLAPEASPIPAHNPKTAATHQPPPLNHSPGQRALILNNSNLAHTLFTLWSTPASAVIITTPELSSSDGLPSHILEYARSVYTREKCTTPHPHSLFDS